MTKHMSHKDGMTYES